MEYLQIGLVVADIETARDELQRAFEIGWSDVLARGGAAWPLRVAMSCTQPPYLELIEGGAGSPWDPAAGPRLDHIAYASAEPEVDRERLVAAGLPVEIDGAPLGRRWTYHRGVASGLRVELLHADDIGPMRERFALPVPGAAAASDLRLFQVGAVVDDLEQAVREVEAGLGVRLSRPLLRDVGPWSLRVAHTDRAPHLELVEGPEGSPWHAGGTPRLDHVAFWAADADAARARFEAAGLALELDGRELGRPWTYHRGACSGLRVEVFPADGEAGLLDAFAFAAATPGTAGRGSPATA